MLQLIGYNTNVDLDALIACSHRLPWMIGHDVPGQVAKARKVSDLHPVPQWLAEIKTRADARVASV
jgi:hydroxymethylglutaryl-CoA lyase